MNVRDLLIVLSSALLISCHPSTRYSEFQSVSLTGWPADSVLDYRFAVNDTTPCDILLCVRHTESYPYQNMWLFCTLGTDSTTIWKDTLEFYLADDRGLWLGNNVGVKTIEMPVIFAQNYQFADTGQYIFTIQHAMREDLLRGISDVGLIIRNGEE